MSFEWEVLTFDQLTINYDTKRKPVRGPDRKPGPYPYYGASGIVDYVDGYIFDGDYLLIAEDGENLRTRQTPIAFMASGKFWVNNHAHIVTGNERANTRYLQYSLLAADISGYLTGAVMPKLTQGNMNKIELSCPPRHIQDEIVRVLGSLDDRISLLRETNATLEAIAQALFKSWFVDFDPVRAKAEGLEPEGMDAATSALFPDSFEESGQGVVPRGWKCSTVEQSFILTMGQSPPGDTYNESGDGLPFYQGRTDFGFRYPTQRIFCNAPTRLAEAGDTLVSVRAPVGDVNVALEPCALGRGVASVRHPNGHQSFVFYSVRSLKTHFELYDGEGTVFGSINKKDFQALPVFLPSESILEAFEGFVAPLDAGIENNEHRLRALTQLRDTLLPRLISGQLRLPEAEMLIKDANLCNLPSIVEIDAELAGELDTGSAL